MLSNLSSSALVPSKLIAKVSVSTQVLRKPDGMSRGFGFITFKDEMSVEKCLVKQHTLNGKQVGMKQEARCTLSTCLYDFAGMQCWLCADGGLH